jgi:hypothetical protein
MQALPAAQLIVLQRISNCDLKRLTSLDQAQITRRLSDTV